MSESSTPHNAGQQDDSRKHREWNRFSLRQRLTRFLSLAVSLIVVIVSWRFLDMNFYYMWTASATIQDLLGRMFPPDIGYTHEIMGPLIETINMAIVGTILAILLALPVAFLAARNTTPNKITYGLGKFIISFTRSVNVIIWALIFVVVFGPGALSGVLALAMRSIGFVSKLLAEAIEEIDPNQVEAIAATGGSSFDILVYGIVPQIKPAFIGVATYRWDINVRAATILGLVGAGGIGVQLNTSVNYFNWDAVLTILIAILVIVAISEVVSAYFRSKTT
ncbi:phosphonate ABC transporter, permease protein PhnE [Natrarchaeobius halalkaliphilus]|uniref:Phosphonate ABC transporter, permease protein PhnE n=1 Tax=Natrarchaeobius halalkaliphilus TaxID=1679091 RepID=A0A3N6LYD2_9EURY|nr:phosphonate ABC transporter, permease protein PhnE [Natrarchaeobius halalkaliphilus]RQG86732.1 phosphonate ABC transporter, permease protein PhnE [Natrarchaeobius halalkaliphilus]